MGEQLSFTELTVSVEDVKRIEDKMDEVPKETPKESTAKAAPKEETKVADKKKSALPGSVCGYSRYEAVSSFHKELRRGDVEKATYWLETLITGGAPSWYIANYLYWISAEELAIEEVHGGFGTYLANLNTHGTKADPYQLYYATMRFCKAKKWWEDEESILMRKLWAENVRVLKQKEKDKMLDVPLYAHDRHTSKGKTLMQKGEADLRYSGMWQGMIWRQKAFEQHGTIDVEWDEVTWEKDEYDFWVWMENEIC